MRALATGVWKEWRDHRAVAIALLLALPVLALSGAWGFGDQVDPAQFASVALLLVPGAIGLFLIAVASEQFAGERRRGTLDFVRRLPAGLSRSLGAKLLAYASGALLFATWGWCLAYAVCALFGPWHACADAWRLTLVEPDQAAFESAQLLLAVGAWLLLVSTWIPQGGAAVLGTSLLLALLALPVLLALKDQQWVAEQLAPQTPGEMTLPMALLALAALLALGISYLRGARLLRGSWSAAWRGLAVVGTLALFAYPVGAAALDRWITLDPAEPAFRIVSACVGVGERFAFLEVRGGLDFGRASDPGETPVQPWIVDLANGSYRVAGRFDEGWAVPPETRYALQPIVLRWVSDDGSVGWYDGSSATLRKVLPWDVRTPEIAVWEREARAALAWHHDARGRALWLEEDRIVREGDPPARSRRVGWMEAARYFAVPGGWLLRSWSVGGGKDVTIDAGSGAARRFSAPGAECLLSPSEIFYPILDRQRPGPSHKWRIRDLDRTGMEREVALPTDADVSRITLMDGRLLVLRGPDPEARRLAVWNVQKGEMVDVPGVAGKQPLRAESLSEWARAPGGLHVLSLWGRDASRGGSFHDLLLLDEHGLRVTPLAEQDSIEVVAIAGAAAAYAVEGGRRLVRYGPEPGSRTVLFPRPGARKE